MNDSEKELRAAIVEARDYHPNVGVFELTTSGALEIIGELDRLRLVLASQSRELAELRKEVSFSREFIDQVWSWAFQSEECDSAEKLGKWVSDEAESLMRACREERIPLAEVKESYRACDRRFNALAEELAAKDADLERLRALVSHIRSLAPNGTRGLGSIMNDVFDAVDAFDKGAILVDPRDAELERLRRSVESAICWLEGRKNHGEHWAITEALNNLKRVSAPAAQAEPQAAPIPHVGDPWDCGGDS